jgi:membrane-associated progesterone receptor component
VQLTQRFTHKTVDYSFIKHKTESETWDDYEDISVAHMASAKEWEEQFSERYDFVGYLVQEGGEEAASEDKADSKEKKED